MNCPYTSTSRQKLFRVFELPGQVGVYDVVKPVFGEGLLLDTNTHLYQLFNGFLPFLVVDDKRVVLERIQGALFVHLLKGVGRELIVYYVLWYHSQIPCIGRAEVLVYVGCVP